VVVRATPALFERTWNDGVGHLLLRGRCHYPTRGPQDREPSPRSGPVMYGPSAARGFKVGAAQAGWQPDPTGRFQYRYWDGTAWSQHVSTNGAQQSDPLGAAPTPPASPGAWSQPTTPTSPISAGARQPSTPVKVLVLAGASALVLGSLLPWVRATAGPFSATRNGIDGDGVLTLILAVAAAGTFWLVTQRTVALVLALVFGALAGAIAIYDIVDISHKARDLASSNSGVSAHVGAGLIIVAIAALAVVVGAVMGIREATASS
jgi:Protein of unknown function (DUF2510)